MALNLDRTVLNGKLFLEETNRSMAQAEVKDGDLTGLKKRIAYIVNADPKQFHDDYSLKRFLRAFETVDRAFQAVLNTNKWRESYGVTTLADTDLKRRFSGKARVLRHRDRTGRPVIYIPAKNHNGVDENTEELTKYIVLCLEQAAARCYDEVADNFCIIFDLKSFSAASMNYGLVKNLIWLLGKHYPERMGICLIYNAPALFSSMWPVIRQLLSDKTAAKVVFVGSELELCKYMVPDILPNDM